MIIASAFQAVAVVLNEMGKARVTYGEEDFSRAIRINVAVVKILAWEEI